MIEFSTEHAIADRQIEAIIFYLTAFGYIDGDFDVSERVFVRDYIRQLAEARMQQAGVTDRVQYEQYAQQYTDHFMGVFRSIDQYVRDLFTETLAAGEDLNNFVYAKLKLRAFEIFESFDEQNQHDMLETVETLIAADGVIHPAEVKFRDEVTALLRSRAPEPVAPPQPVAAPTLTLQAPIVLSPVPSQHPVFDAVEQRYSTESAVLMSQAAADYQLAMHGINVLNELRQTGAGRLAGKQTVAELAGQPPFLDEFTYVLPPEPGKAYELIVLGDLHGCYGCLKAALLQSDFLGKVQAYQRDPRRNPDVKLILLGDYIDRGIYSLEGVLRMALSLLTMLPQHVYLLRGNHEFYVEKNGQIMSGVLPAEAIKTWLGPLPMEHFRGYKMLFDSLPSSLLFERTLFVHAGMPRQDTLDQAMVDLSSLNNPNVRFQMMWSDPANVDWVPLELQQQNARFPFGKQQFRRFMSRIGSNTLIRGHEKIEQGFLQSYDEGDLRLMTLFSAGGSDNLDLPEQSSYRLVTPMAMTITYRDGEHHARPWQIDYSAFNTPQTNGFLRAG